MVSADSADRIRQAYLICFASADADPLGAGGTPFLTGDHAPQTAQFDVREAASGDGTVSGRCRIGAGGANLLQALLGDF